MKNVMIDIETMGTHTSLSLILSVGAVAFDLTAIGANLSETRFLEVLALEPQILGGRIIDPGTQRWWSLQTPEARAHWELAKERIHPAYLRDKVSNYLREQGVGEATFVWANGIVFDLGNLEHLFGGFNPWKYNVVRDARTMYQLPKKRAMPENLTFVGHDPVEDCRKQIWRLWEHMPEEMLE